jgi:Flp pilus assembly protein TadG
MTFSMLKYRLKNLREQGERGSILILVVLSALIIVGSAGLAVDVGRLYAAKAELSRAVDAAALSGVLEFNGTAGGLTNASTKACAYLQANEPTASCAGINPNGGTSTLTINASKTVRLYFLPIFGINTSVVSAKAISGFNNATVDAVMVVDSTGSMDGPPINNAKTAANNFKNTLLGSSPGGNVVVGVVPFRGCNRSTTPNALKPWVDTHSLCVSQENEYTALTSNSTTLSTRINAICPADACPGGSGTNVCTGLAKGWEVLEGTGNHTASANNRRFLVILSDGDNTYTGSYTYQNTPYVSPHTYQTKPCQPPTSCTNVGGESTGTDPCQDGYFTTFASEASDDFASACTSWSGGTGWTAAWTRSSTEAPVQLTTSTPLDTSCHVRMRGVGTMCRGVNLTGVAAASVSYYAKINSWESTDRSYLEVNTTSCTASSGWTVLKTHDNLNTGTSYGSPTSVVLDAYAGATVYIRWRGGMTAGGTADDLFIDNIDVSSGSSGSSNGYQNGSDASIGCGASVKRERQVDMLTRDMAVAAKADNVEIFVVAFGLCSNTTTYIPTATECTATSGTSYIGNADADATADQRLLKCISSSQTGTLDHYFYAASASALPAIFTTIAAQIAHRLVE